MDIENILYGEHKREPVEKVELVVVRERMYPPQPTSVMVIRKRAKAVMARRAKQREQMEQRDINRKIGQDIRTILHNVRLIREV